jgi:hypothetical protein
MLLRLRLVRCITQLARHCGITAIILVVAVVSAATAAASKSREIKVDFLYYQLRITLGIKVSHRMLAEDPLWLTTMLLELLWYYSFWFALYVRRSLRVLFR